MKAQVSHLDLINFLSSSNTKFRSNVHLDRTHDPAARLCEDAEHRQENIDSRTLHLRRSSGYDLAATQQSDAACLLNCYTLSGPDLDLPIDSQTFKDFQVLLQSQTSGCDIMMNILHRNTEYFTPSEVSVIHMIYRINNWMLRLLRHTPARVAAAFDNTALIISLIVLFYRRCPLKG